MRYLGFIIGGLIYYRINKKYAKVNIQDTSSVITLSVEKTKPQKNRIIDMIIIGVIYYINSESRKILYLMNFYSIDLWPFNIIFLVIFMKLYFKMEFYTYMKCSLIFIIVTNIILLLTNTFLPQSPDDHKNEYDMYKEAMGNAAYCIPFLIIFICMYSLLSYARVKIKVITTFKFISNSAVIISMGLCGIVLTIIEIIISENVQCDHENMLKAFQSLCRISTTENESYYDELNTFFIDFGKLTPINIFINILSLLFHPVINFLEILCELSIIYYLNPIFILIQNNVYYFCLRIIHTSITANGKDTNYFNARFFILEIADLLALLGECIFLQLIELKFCGLDKNLNKNIIDRSQEESTNAMMEMYSRSDSDVTIFTDDDKLLYDGSYSLTFRNKNK